MGYPAGKLTGAAVLALLAACGPPPAPVPETSTSDGAPDATFMGSASCGSCHVAEYERWTGSHHQLAMQPATDATVLGDFSDESVSYFGRETRFTMRDDRFYVETQDASNEDASFEVAYTFGVEPLQQYLVPMPGGRLQALPFAWDTRPADEGGQRWFHLYPDEPVLPGDPLHWTGRELNWNYMCAECHSTDVRLGYDRAADRFDTTFAEVSVGCEACHGPGSVHAGQAEAGRFSDDYGLPVDLDDRSGAAWVMNPDTGIAERSEPRASPRRQPEACGRCHARRGVIAPDYVYGKPLTDTHLPALLEEPLYFADGQIRDEVYVYGSFLQSRMYRAGVTCSDCHDPHSAKLRTGAHPDAVCAQCHLPAKFAAAEHHHHDEGAVRCVDCHMPARTYMLVDDRRDHRFAVPRPDLTASAGSPNACNGCHAERTADWASDALETWYGQSVFERPEFATAIAAGRAGYANAALVEVAQSPVHPGIARATALTLLQDPLSPNALRVLAASLDDPDPLLRIAAHRVIAGLPPDMRLGFGAEGLSDPRRAVRHEAARAFAEVAGLLPQARRDDFASAAAEYRAALEQFAFRPGAQADLGEFARRRDDLDAAIAHYRRALEMQPQSAIVRVNLADLYRETGNEVEARRVLGEGLEHDPGNALLLHARGLALARAGHMEASIDALRQAAGADRSNPRFAYVLGVALNSSGDSDGAVDWLRGAWQRFPHDFDIGWALATIHRDRGERQQALSIARDLRERHPQRREVAALLDELERGK